VARLLDSGATIRDVNLVRRHLSRIKGGRLGSAANGARVLTLMLSDVIDGAPHDIGSGPTVFDPTTVEEAAVLLTRMNDPGLRSLPESIKPGAFRAGAKIVAGPEDLASQVARALARRDVRARVERDAHADVRAICEARIASAARLRDNEAIVIACEPTIALPA